MQSTDVSVPTGGSARTGDLRRPWYREVSADAWRVLRAAGLGWLFEVFDLYVLALTAPALIIAFDLSRADAGLLTSVSAGGAIVGGIVFGWVADRIGRVRTLFLSILIYSLCTGAIALAPSLGWLVALRLVGGLGMGGAWTAGASLIAETWHPDHRGKGGALMQMGLPLGSMLAIGVVALVSLLPGGLEHGGWRWVYGIGALPIVVLVLFGRNTPESPVWLRRSGEKRPGGNVGALFRGETGRGLLIAFGFIFFVQYVYWAVFTWTPTFLVTVKHFAFIKSLGFTLTQQLGSLAGFVVFAMLVDQLGRRPTFVLYLLIGAAAVLGLVMSSDPDVLLVASFFTGFGIGGIFAGMGPFTAELIRSTHSRALGMAIAYNGGRIGGLIAPSLIGWLATDAHGFEAGMLTTTFAFGLAIVVLLFAPETKGMTIE
ncbi:MFS transporter [Bradyrhizobium sp. NAS80.1]|uniref:MFS transporter n=1 Tax=Bradyrhizobium sp. NAS80.1 TaxID=1680159 RepID=UPI0009FFF170|nr:MFS transporter [Bradyrhizobium sp. NAS80.1]